MYLVRCCFNSELCWKAANSLCPELGEAEVLYWGTPGRNAPPRDNPGSTELPPFVHTPFSTLLAARAWLKRTLAEIGDWREGGLSNLEGRHPQKISLSQILEKETDRSPHLPACPVCGPPAGERAASAGGSGAPCCAAPLTPAAAFRAFFSAVRVFASEPGRYFRPLP